MLAELRRIGGTGVKFHGVVSEAAIVQMLESCRAVCIAGEEEFGIVAVEAQAAGKPVIAYGRGGSLETVEEHVTGVLFQEQTEEALATAILAGERLDASPEELATRAQRFGRAAFRQNLLAAIEAQRLVSPPTNALRGRSRVRAGR
jgi:glycosyltransferase involved in cell wall biosynthesis